MPLGVGQKLSPLERTLYSSEVRTLLDKLTTLLLKLEFELDVLTEVKLINFIS